MCWKCDHPDSTMQEWMELIYEKVKENGWIVQYVSGHMSFAYTIGLHERGLPELLVTGMPPERANLVLTTVGEYLLKGGRPVPGERMLIGGELLLDFVQVQHPSAHLKFAANFYGPDLRALQLVWPDEHGHRPWCAEFSNGGVRQPVFGIRVDPPERRDRR
ncbi:DUF4262 domain-containing protein [Mycobacterium sp.]|uniref:DUF4262 domain-containing protein n=1 Tax=Mycobacterium sp. TaxID=1785 RepID=UPI003D146428